MHLSDIFHTVCEPDALKYLWLDPNSPDHFRSVKGPSGARAIATALYYNPHITNINLSLNKIEERGAAYLW
jgi:hypothetical protein